MAGVCTNHFARTYRGIPYRAVIRDVMPAFELFQPASIEDAQAVLDRYGSGAWVLAGGLDSFDWLKDRIRRPERRPAQRAERRVCCVGALRRAEGTVVTCCTTRRSTAPALVG